MTAPPDHMDLWVLAGQSNMVGRAPLKGAHPPHQRVWCLSSAGQWETARDPLHRLWESFTPVHQRLMRAALAEDLRHLSDEHLAEQERRARSGAGLGVAFGAALTEAHGRPVGLIPCSHGGASLAQWAAVPGGAGGCSLYGGMMERIGRARQRGELRGILWYQGETDALSRQDADSYAQRFSDWISAVRSDTGQGDLPVVVVQIGRICDDPARYPGIDAVRRALGELPTLVPCTAATSAIDLGLCDDCHIDTEGLIRIGRRLARSALRLTVQRDLPAGPFVISIEPGAGEKDGQHAIRVVLDGVTGRLHPAENLSGFSLDDSSPSGTPLRLYSADISEEERPSPGTACIRLVINQEPTATMRVAYGQGLAPHCNVADSADMPLCAFPPRPVTSPQARSETEPAP